MRSFIIEFVVAITSCKKVANYFDRFELGIKYLKGAILKFILWELMGVL